MAYKLYHAPEFPRELVKTENIGHHFSRFLIKKASGKARGFPFLTGPQLMLMLLIHGPHFEQHCSILVAALI